MNYIKSFTMLLMMAFVISCSKDNPEIADDPANASELREKILGKWTFDNDIGFEVSGAYRGKAFRTSARSENAARPLVSRSMGVRAEAVQSGANGFVEFLDDNTYLLYDGYEGFFSGKFEAKDGQTLLLSELGTITDIRFAQEKIDFKVTFSGTNQTLTVVANKAADVPMDDRTKLLCRTWLLSDVEDGQEIYDEPYEIYDNDGNLVESMDVDKLTITMSSAGTYAIRVYSNEKIVGMDMANWKWHSTNSNQFVYWWFDWEPDEDEDFVEIRELTQNVFRTLEYWYYDGQREEIKYTFTPLNP